MVQIDKAPESVTIHPLKQFAVRIGENTAIVCGTCPEHAADVLCEELERRGLMPYQCRAVVVDPATGKPTEFEYRRAVAYTRTKAMPASAGDIWSRMQENARTFEKNEELAKQAAALDGEEVPDERG